MGLRNPGSKISICTDFDSPLHGCLDVHPLYMYIIIILFHRIAIFKYFSFSTSK